MSQREKVLKHLITRGSITPLEAMKRFGCFRLASRIRELRKEGVAIVTHSVITPSGARHAKYVLGDGQ